MGKFDIFKHNSTQNVLTYDPHLCCLQWLAKTNLTKIGVWRKSCSTIFSCCAEIKRSHWVPSKGCVAVDPSIRDVDRSKRRWCARTRIAITYNYLSFLVRFSNFSKEKELTVQCWSSATIATGPALPKKPATICFEVVFHKQLSLNLAWVQRLTGWSVVLFRTHMHRSMFWQLWRSCKRFLKHRHRMFPTFLCSNRQEPFWSVCGIQREQKFLRPAVHAISNVCWWQ